MKLFPKVLLLAILAVVVSSTASADTCPGCTGATKVFELDLHPGQNLNLTGPDYEPWGNPNPATRGYLYQWSLWNTTNDPDCTVWTAYNDSDQVTDLSNQWIRFDIPPSAGTSHYLIELYVTDMENNTCVNRTCGIINVEKCCPTLVDDGDLCWGKTNPAERDPAIWPASDKFPNTITLTGSCLYTNGLKFKWYFNETPVYTGDESLTGLLNDAWNDRPFGVTAIWIEVLKKMDTTTEVAYSCNLTNVTKVAQPLAQITQT